MDINPKATVLGCWSDDTTSNVTTMSNAKLSLLLRDNRWEDFHAKISPYFKDLLPLTDNWWKVLAEGIQKETGPRVYFSDILAIFDAFLPTMPDERSTKVVKLDIQADYANFISSITIPTLPALTSTSLTSQKHLLLSDGVGSMDNPPIKHFKNIQVVK